MSPEYAARNVTSAVLEHLERRRYAIRGDVGRARAEVVRCLEPMRRAYLDEDLPPSYLAALETELVDALPERWCAGAERMTERELQDFGVWRGGDVIARLTYVFFFAMAAAIIIASQAPVLLKLVAGMLALSAWWLPAAQMEWHRRAYRQAVDRIADDIACIQPQLERRVTAHELLLASTEACEQGGAAHT